MCFLMGVCFATEVACGVFCARLGSDERLALIVLTQSCVVKASDFFTEVARGSTSGKSERRRAPIADDSAVCACSLASYAGAVVRACALHLP